MNLLAWVLSLTFFIVLMMEAVVFHRATVCRQEAWLKSTELVTRSTLTNARPYERDWHLSCRLNIVRQQEQVSWQHLPSLRLHTFELPLKGRL